MLRAMLTFRVGVVDETMPTRGITHLVEHLAMFPIMQARDSARRLNASVEPFRTRFMGSGTPEEITTFLADVTSNLSHLPLDRVDSEKKVLRTEAANRTTGSAKAAWSFRFGARGPGLLDYEEFGLRWLGAPHVASWAGTWFTAGNAVLWLSGSVPENLRLKLPPGPRSKLPDQEPIPYTTPASYQQGDRWALLSMLGARESALAIGTSIFDNRIRDRLRNEQSLSYEVHAGYQRLDKDHAEVTAFADSLAPNAKQAAETLVQVAQALAKDGPTPEELAAAIADRRRSMQHPERGLGRLEHVALDELEGLEHKTIAELDAEAESLTPDAVAAAFRDAFQTAFVAVPKDIEISTPGFTPIPISTGRRIRGVPVLAAPGSGHHDVLEYSNEGISLTMPGADASAADQVIGMTWQDVAVALWWGDGKRTLISTDGAGINVIPAKWRNVGPVLEALRSGVPPERWVPMDDPATPPPPAGA